MDILLTTEADRPRQQAFVELLDAHRGIVRKIAMLYAGNRDEREDLAQEIAAQLWRSFARFDPVRAKFSTWMYRVALNVAISHARRRAETGHTDPLEDWHLDSVADGTANDEPDPRLLELRRFIGQLDALNRALVLLYLEDRSYAEIAEVLGLSTTNVATKLNRIKHTLRKQLTQSEPTGA
ncbi:MAG TPA: RNA polymerase sigma factor [Rhodanobacteraceae bacterium]|nr:RNA polymerase sigma factor [Rhodanobacteraceae bacterium]